MIAPVRLKLAIRNVSSLDNGLPTHFELAQRGAIIGRSPASDWSLPDPRAYVSSRHCEISFSQGSYLLTDCSTNGTFLNGATERMPGPHLLATGDVFQVGHYEVVATIIDERPAAPAAETAPSEWGGWEPMAPPPPAIPVAPGWEAADTPPSPAANGWGAPPAVSPAASDWGVATPFADAGPGASAPSSPTGAHDPGSWDAPQSTPVTGGWGAAPVSVAPPPPPPPAGAATPWDASPAPAAAPTSGWSNAPAATPAAPLAEDAWGKFSASYEVDWTRGGFGAAGEAAVPEIAFSAPALEQVAPPAVPDAPATGTERRQQPRRVEDKALYEFLAAAGIERSAIKGQETEVMTMAGGLLRRLVAGLVVMIEARARAKAQMGAQSTVFSREGNNPLKFARSPEGALAQILNPKVTGYMSADRAVEDSFRDLQLHQVATLKAMQGALRTTLARFSPDAIRSRAEASALARILPGARDAALWKAYEREFGGVAQGSDEAFMDVFAKEFRKAYEEQAQ